IEVRFLDRTLGDGDVLLPPGSPFPELLYLSHLNLFEVWMGERTHRGSEVPVLHPGKALRARIAWWLEKGSRLVYALGDESTDFSGDLGGAEQVGQVLRREHEAARGRA